MASSLLNAIDYDMNERKAKSLGTTALGIPLGAAYTAAGVGTSVLTSFFNTGVSVANMFREDDIDYADTEDWVRKWAGNKAAEFYDDHEGAIELGGLIAGSFVPGGVAVKGFRALQASKLKGLADVAAGKPMGLYSRISTGLRNSIRPPSQLKQLTQEIRKHNVNALYAPGTRFSLFRDGARQQILESFVFEAATLATMVANPTLSNEDLDYFEALAQNKGSFVFGGVLGGAVGGGIQYAVSKGKLDKLAKEVTDQLNPLVKNAYKSTQADLFGDRLWDRNNVLREKTELLRTLEGKRNNQTTQTAAGDVEQLQNTIRAVKNARDQAKNELIKEMGENIPQPVVRERLTGLLQTMEPEKISEFVGGMDRISTLAMGGNLRDPVLDLVMRLEDLDNPPATGVLFDARKKLLTIDRKELAKMDSEELLDMWDQTISGMKAEEALGILEGSGLKSNMDAELRKFHNVELKPLYDEINVLETKLTKATGEDAELISQLIEVNQQKLVRLERPTMGLRSLYKKFLDADGETFKQMKKDLPTIHKVFAQSRNAKEIFGPTEAYLDLATGNLARTDAVVPRAVDLGNLSVKANNVQIEGTNFAYDLSAVKHIKDMSLTEATARMSIAETSPDELLRGYVSGRATDKVIETYDIPRVYAAMHKILNTKDGGKFPRIKYRNVNGDVIETKNVKELMIELKRAKRRAVPELADTGKHSMTQIAEMLDVDVSWVNGHYAVNDAADDFSRAFRNMSNDGLSTTLSPNYSDPRWLKVDYARSFESEAEIHGMLQMEKRINDNLRQNKELALHHFGPEAKNMLGDLDTGAVSSGDRGNEFLTANHSRYDLAGMKGAGAFLQNRANKQQVDIERAFSNTARKLVKNPEAIAEMNVANNMARQGKYYYFENIQDFIQKEVGLKGNEYRDLTELFLADPNFAQTLSRSLRATVGLDEGGLLSLKVISPIRDALISADLQIGKKLAANEPIDNMVIIQSIQDAMNKTVPNISEEGLKGTKLRYAFQNDDAKQFISQYVGENNKTIQSRRILAERTGNNISYEENMFYAGAIDTEKFNAVAFVKFADAEKVYGSKNVGVIVANTQEDLAKKIAVAEREFGDKVQIIPRGKQKEALEAMGVYDASIDMTENIVDTTMYNRGVLWDVMPEYNPHVVEDMVKSHIKSVRNLDRGYMELLYEREIAELRQMEKAYSPSAYIDPQKQKASTNAWGRQVNAILNLPNETNASNYLGAQQKMADALSKAYDTIGGMFRVASKSQLDAEWKRMDEYLEKTGLPRVYSGGVENYLKLNSNIRGEKLEALVSKGNSVAATLMLRLDQAQAVVNAMSMPITMIPAMKELRKFASPTQLAKLDEMTSVVSPTGKEPTNAKLMMDAVAEFFTSPNRKTMIAELKAQGIVGNDLHEIINATEAITLSPKQDYGTIMKGLNKGVAILSSVTDKSEEFVKFVAARSAQKMLENSGVPTKAHWAIVRSFVDRVHGNYVASQRPTLFRGFAGQAIGLFQTYQFNLMQQLFGAISRGDKQAIIGMVGAQASIFGAQSLPGFQLLNDHIANRHSDYKNLYSEARNNFGDELSEWIIYGAGSNMFKPLPGLGGLDLFSRGDLTPRTPILIPTTPSEIPIVSITAKMMRNAVNTVQKTAEAIGAGAPDAIPTIMGEALAHNGVNRPLAGIAQVGLGYRTTNQGSLINTYNESDFISWASAAKAIGSKDLDEGIAVNQYYRTLGYRTSRLEKTAGLGRTLKDVIRANNGQLAGDTYMEFMRRYVANGGTYDGYKQWVQNQMTGATTSVINELRRENNSREGRYLQSVMGADLNDFVSVQ